MADFMNEQEIQDAMKRLAENFQQGYITAEEYNKGMKDATVGIRGYTAGLKASMAQLGTSFKQLGKDIYDGKQGAAVFNNTMDAGANAVAAYALKFGPAGVALGLFTKAVTSFVGAANKQSDLLFDSYQKISRAGVVGADAMKEVFDNMQRLGYTQDQLGEMGQVLASNSKGLALLGKSAIAGSKQFVDLAGEMQASGLRTQFFNLGMSVTDINQASAGYLVQLGRLGRSSQATAAGAADYIREMEILTRLTGQQREEMEAQREAATAIDEFQAALMEMTPAARKVAEGVYNQLSAIDPKMALGYASSINGIIGQNQESVQLFQATNGQLLDINAQITAGKFKDAGEAIRALGLGAREQLPVSQELAKYGANYAGMLRSQALLAGKVNVEYKEMAGEVDAAMVGTEKTTASQAKIRNNQILAAQSLQSFVNMGVGPATTAMEIFTDVVENLTSLLPGSGTAADRQLAKQTGQTVQQIKNQRATTSFGEGEFSGAGLPGMQGAPEAGPSGDLDFRKNLKLKPGAENKGTSSDALYGVADQVHKMLGGDYKYFSGFNDRDGKSKHASGQAFDLVLNDASKYENVVSQIKSITGVSFAQFERAGQKNPNGSIATGDHIHAEVSAANGAILSGPMGGYKPNLTMHGTEAVVPLNTAAQQSAAGMMDNSIMSAQLGRLEEMVSLMKNQLNVSTKIMQYSS
jgi:hypothetical protein